MAKKKKVEEVVINYEELKPTVLKTIEEEKSSMIPIILLFVIFLSVVYFLPDLTLLYEQYMEKNPVVNPNNSEVKKPNNQEEAPIEEEKVYQFVTNMVIEKDNHRLTNFAYTNNILTFKVENKMETLLDLQKENNYLEVFVSETLIKRIKIEDQILALGNIDYSVEINEGTISYLTYNSISIEDYPAFNVLANDLKEGTLVCTLNNETLTYRVKENKLKTIDNTTDMPKSDPNYQLNLTNYQSSLALYNTFNGVNSTIIDDDFKTTFNATIDLSAANLEQLNNKLYYPLDTDAKVIKFEMESRGYTCK